jgi:hypothetical protein
MRYRKGSSFCAGAVRIIPCVLLLFAPGRSSGQTSEVWLDYFANWVSGPDWSFEVNPGIAKGLTDPLWLEAYLGGNASYQPAPWFITEGNLEFHYTFNTTVEDFLEVRPWLGFNFILPKSGGPLHLFYPSISLRLEERFFWYQTSGEKESKERLRLRIFLRFPINNVTLQQGTFYVLFLAEGYAPIDGQAREVSADKHRLQAGLGYVVAPDLRVELQYLLMRTRNTELNTFEEGSQIVWLALRNFF